MHFSDPSYQFPQIEALRSGKVMSTGTTLPMSLEGVDRVTGDRGQFIVKFIKSPRMSEKASAKELIAAWNTTEVAEIRDYLFEIVKHRDEFADQLIQTLL